MAFLSRSFFFPLSFRAAAYIGQPNDNFANSTTIPGDGGTVTRLKPWCHPESGEPNPTGQASSASVWWRWTAPGNGPVIVTTLGSTFDTVLGVYTGSVVTSLTKVAEGDDYNNSNNSYVSFNAVAGVTYQIEVDGYNYGGPDTGNIVLSVIRGGIYSTPPANDLFAHRKIITGTMAHTVANYTVGATAEAGGALSFRSRRWPVRLVELDRALQRHIVSYTRTAAKEGPASMSIPATP